MKHKLKKIEIAVRWHHCDGKGTPWAGYFCAACKKAFTHRAVVEGWGDCLEIVKTATGRRLDVHGKTLGHERPERMVDDIYREILVNLYIKRDHEYR